MPRSIILQLQLTLPLLAVFMQSLTLGHSSSGSGSSTSTALVLGSNSSSGSSSERSMGPQPLFELGMAKEDVKARLAPIPVYTVANPKNEFVLVAGEVSSSCRPMSMGTWVNVLQPLSAVQQGVLRS